MGRPGRQQEAGLGSSEFAREKAMLTSSAARGSVAPGNLILSLPGDMGKEPGGGGAYISQQEENL